MKPSRNGLGLIALFAVIAIAGCEDGPEPADFKTGTTREALVARFGEPDRRQTLVKSSPHVWDPIETFWSQVPMKSKVEIWGYAVNGGMVELYFVNGSGEVTGKGIAAKGAVY